MVVNPKKILVISYIFPPLDSIVSAHRPYSWCLELSRRHHSVTVVTRKWTGKEAVSPQGLSSDISGEPIIINSDVGSIHYLPFKSTRIFKAANDVSQTSFLSVCKRRLAEVVGLMLGSFSNEVDIHDSFYRYVDKLVLRESFDAVIVTALPLSAVRLAASLRERHSLLVVVDFRDHINNNLLNRKYPFSLRARFYFLIQKLWLRKWLRNADLLVSASETILSDIQRLCEAPGITIHNGFEDAIFTGMPHRKGHCHIFRVSLIGVLYPTQDIELLISGINQFLFDVRYNPLVVFQFIGQEYFPDVSDKLRKSIPAENLLITNRIPREHALKQMFSSHVLLYSGWLGWKGIYSGKIFEYLASGRPTILLPGDHDVLDALLLKTRGGVSTFTPRQFSLAMIRYWREWQACGHVSTTTDMIEVSKYKRSRLAAKLIERLDSLFDANIYQR